jgi:TPR repeat protein
VRAYALATLFSLGTAVNAATPLEEADAARTRGDLSAAVAAYQALADVGDAEAMTRLGALLQKGEGVPRDPTQAAALYARAAAAGNAEAQFNLGNLYLMGEGVPQDDDWAFTYYRQAASQGHELARKNVNEFYRAAGMTPPETLPMPPTGALPVELPPATNATEKTADADSDEDTSVTPEAVVGEVPATLSSDELTAIELARAHGIRLDGLDGAPVPQATQPEVQAPLPPEALPAPDTANEGPAPVAPALDSPSVPSPSAPGPARDYAGLTKGELEVLADAGDARAHLALAQRARLAGSEDEALMWLEKAKGSDDADVQFALGEAWLSGKTPDEAAAITWFRAAARQGHAGALKALETIYQQAGIAMPPL